LGLFQNQARPKILLQKGDGCAAMKTMKRVFESVWPSTQAEWVEDGWARRLQEPDVGGLVAETDALPSSTLHLLQALLECRPEVEALFLVGSRGLPGFEGFLKLGNVVLLPQPWTPAALESLAGLPRHNGRPVPAAFPTPAPLPARKEPQAPSGNGSAPDPLSVLRSGLSALGERQEEIRSSLLKELGEKNKVIQSQVIEIARLRKERQRAEEERSRDDLLRGVFLHRDRLAGLLEDTQDPRSRNGVAAALRSLDEFLATAGIVIEDHPDPHDPLLCRVVGVRQRTSMDPPAGWILRKPAYLKKSNGRRRILKPAEIETLNETRPEGIP